MMTQENKIVLFKSKDKNVTLEVTTDMQTVWLTQDQMAALFDTARSSITYHIGNIFKEGELEQETSVEIFDRSNASRPPKYYNLDVIISVGYRVKSHRGIEFRRWANQVLKNYILNGYAVNQQRLEQLKTTVNIMTRVQSQLQTEQVLSIIDQYTTALDLLDAYDHRCIEKPEGNRSVYRITYDECKKLIDTMKFSSEGSLFGNEKDDSFKGSIENIYQTFGGVELFPTIEEKAANLLYYVTKNHSFSDGNKRIAAAVFLHFLDKNSRLFKDGRKIIADYTLVAIIVMIAESKPEEKETMVRLIMNFLV